MKKRLQRARSAYKQKDLEELKKSHTAKAIKHAPEEHESSGTYIGDFVYGAIDGSITTFAVVSGVAGAALSVNIVIILGVANLLADGLSMAMGNYLRSKSNLEFIQKEREREEWEIKHYPEGEIEEIRDIFKRKGFEGKDLERAVKVVTSDEKVWVDTMMADELKLVKEDVSPVKKGGVTLVSFIVVGAIPLVPYLLSFFVPAIKEIAYPVSIVMTFIAFFLIGSAKVYITEKNWFKSGLETLFIGGLAAIVAYAVGFMLRGLV